MVVCLLLMHGVCSAVGRLTGNYDRTVPDDPEERGSDRTLPRTDAKLHQSRSGGEHQLRGLRARAQDARCRDDVNISPPSNTTFSASRSRRRATRATCHVFRKNCCNQNQFSTSFSEACVSHTTYVTCRVIRKNSGNKDQHNSSFWSPLVSVNLELYLTALG